MNKQDVSLIPPVFSTDKECFSVKKRLWQAALPSDYHPYPEYEHLTSRFYLSRFSSGALLLVCHYGESKRKLHWASRTF